MTRLLLLNNIIIMDTKTLFREECENFFFYTNVWLTIYKYQVHFDDKSNSNNPFSCISVTKKKLLDAFNTIFTCCSEQKTMFLSIEIFLNTMINVSLRYIILLELLGYVEKEHHQHISKIIGCLCCYTLGEKIEFVLTPSFGTYYYLVTSMLEMNLVCRNTSLGIYLSVSNVVKIGEEECVV
ncbi:hypothetical protein BDA99DRAFT_575400 [Phascolomyces articulosus]|uniref:Uncharacterized protein n=1 Tax=Phascolomyces articulosus TaxID=60185 RepID=A0AAD5P9V6_9FUNG|nr:hypothetical protein BDA99DRAFT_575400 [Phascolomyces articulosus]